MSESVSKAVVIPDDSSVQVRKRLGLPPNSELRIAFVAGPGDVVGTFEFWQRGEHDPRTPVIAYSSMFYSVVEAIGAEAMILAEQDRLPTVQDRRFTFVHTPRRRNRRGFAYRVDERRFAQDVLRQIRTFQPHIVLFGTDAPSAVANGLPASVRKILTAHNALWPMGRKPNSFKARLTLGLRARALRKAHSLVSTSQECALQVASIGGPTGERSFVEIPQILPNFFPADLTPAPRARRVLFLGRIEANKGVFDLLGAFASVAAENPEITLDIAGTGSADSALSQEIARLPCSDRITVHGLLDAKGVHHRLASADLLVCPTRSDFAEGLALVVLEAAVHGVPTLLSSVVPAKSLLPDACVEFPVDDVGALTGSLRRIVEDPVQYAALCAKVATHRELFRDRSRSWGSMLYRALVA